MTADDFDELVDDFNSAQAGAIAHLETMSKAAREAAEEMRTAGQPMGDKRRAHAARLSLIAEQCDALGLSIGALDLPPAPDGD